MLSTPKSVISDSGVESTIPACGQIWVRVSRALTTHIYPMWFPPQVIWEVCAVKLGQEILLVCISLPLQAWGWSPRPPPVLGLVLF